MSPERNTEVRGPTAADIKALIEAERTGLPFLYWRTDEGLQQILVLDSERPRVTVGRRSDSDIPLKWDLEVSRAHALFEPVGGQWTVLDDGLSRNGTYVNGSRLHGRQRLTDRDRLCFGRTFVVFREVENPEGGASTARANENATAVPLSETQRKILIALCRPVVDSESPRATPATNKQIALEVSHSVESIKSHLRLLFDRFGLGGLPQNEKRAHLAGRVLADNVLKPHDF
jgi:pSer/pThr/pTyr-binding forkhead associated (FHA) protein